jgi:hypothetical protein
MEVHDPGMVLGPKKCKISENPIFGEFLKF